MRDRNHELVILLFSSNAKRFWNLHDQKITITSLLHIQKHSTTVPHGLQWLHQNPPQHVPIMQRTTEKHFDDFVTYPKARSNCIAWTSAWVNQKGYVACSYNVTHDGKIPITILLHISNYSWTSAWVNLKGYEHVPIMYVTHVGKITLTILLHILKHSSATVLHGLQPGWTRKYPLTLGNVNSTWTFAWANQRAFIICTYTDFLCIRNNCLSENYCTMDSV